MNYIAVFFSGLFLINSIPHIVAGVQGISFPTPFAKPSGIGDSSPFVNFLWGFFNLLLGIYLLSKHPVKIGINLDFVTLVIGMLLIGIFSSINFGRVRGKLK